MKTAEEILKETYLEERHKMADNVYNDTREMVLDAMEIFAHQFKSPSPVSQQLTIDKLKKVLSQYRVYDFNQNLIPFLESDVGKNIWNEVSQLYCPDAQKEIRELQIDRSNIITEKNQLLADAYKEIEELKAEKEELWKEKLFFMKESGEKTKQIIELMDKLTSKESDVKRAVEALDLAKAEIKSCYNKLGYKGSSVIQKIDEALKGNK